MATPRIAAVNQHVRGRSRTERTQAGATRASRTRGREGAKGWQQWSARIVKVRAKCSIRHIKANTTNPTPASELAGPLDHAGPLQQNLLGLALNPLEQRVARLYRIDEAHDGGRRPDPRINIPLVIDFASASAGDELKENYVQRDSRRGEGGDNTRERFPGTRLRRHAAPCLRPPWRFYSCSAGSGSEGYSKRKHKGQAHLKTRAVLWRVRNMCVVSLSLAFTIAALILGCWHAASQLRGFPAKRAFPCGELLRECCTRWSQSLSKRE